MPIMASSHDIYCMFSFLYRKGITRSKIWSPWSWSLVTRGRNREKIVVHHEVELRRNPIRIGYLVGLVGDADAAGVRRHAAAHHTEVLVIDRHVHVVALPLAVHRAQLALDGVDLAG